MEAGYAEAEKILTTKRADLETLAKGLLEFETLTGDEIIDLIAGKRPSRESDHRAGDAARFRRASGRQATAASARSRWARAAAAGVILLLHS